MKERFRGGKLNVGQFYVAIGALKTAFGQNELFFIGISEARGLKHLIQSLNAQIIS